MTLVREFGKPDYSITMATNPKWTKIKEALFEDERSQDRTDITDRVFEMKYDSLKYDLLKKNVLGKVVAHASTIEWQKTSLPHVHILLFMAATDKPRTPEIIYRVLVCGEITDKHMNPGLLETVVEINIHGSCGCHNPNRPCMDGDPPKGTKSFPKQCRSTTFMSDEDYPRYRRQSPTSGSRKHIIRTSQTSTEVNNSFIVS
ncbi:Hypothetical predicted protein [Octopus vulgaris]|uniref:Helitron helicase-like domain-containing protein n=1 Tax=Octopus vulgaris TaxID=6645 RepID=A0AA36BK19_OCTVU|nr:Hypothetical predicted protein [Octopus vulgaris]